MPAATAAVKITSFYASPPNPARGEKTLVCYGVENASEVRLDPPVEQVFPAMSRCFNYTPTAPVTLKLTAIGENSSVTQSLEVRPGAPRVQIIEVSINSLTVKSGEPVLVCHKSKNATQVTIVPGTWRPEGNRLTFGCVEHHPLANTTYLVTATGADGTTDSEHVSVRVK